MQDTSVFSKQSNGGEMIEEMDFSFLVAKTSYKQHMEETDIYLNCTKLSAHERLPD